jgi:hypothetical protein
MAFEEIHEPFQIVTIAWRQMDGGKAMAPVKNRRESSDVSKPYLYLSDCTSVAMLNAGVYSSGMTRFGIILCVSTIVHFSSTAQQFTVGL